MRVTAAFALLVCVQTAAESVPEYSCDQGGYSSEPLFQVEADNLAACKDYCSNVNECSSISFDKTNSCNVYGADATKVSSKGTRCTKAPVKHTSENYPCTMHKTSTADEILMLEGVSANDPSCFEGCNGMPSCTAVVFDISESTCSLRLATKDNKPASLADSASHMTCSKPTSGDDSQTADGFKCAEGKRFAGESLFTIEQVATLRECKEHCSNTAGCVRFVYKNNECVIMQGAGDATEVDAAAASCSKEGVPVQKAAKKQPAAKSVGLQATAGPVTKKRDFHCQKGSYGGTELMVVEGTDSLQTCESHCATIDGCVGLTHSGEACSLFGLSAVLDTKKEGTSCSVLKPLQFDCAQGKRFANALFEIGDVESLEECKRQCAAFNNVCRGVNYGADKGCELVGSVDAYASEFEKGTESCAVLSTSTTKTAPARSRFACSTGSAKGADLVAFENVKTLDECTEFCLSIGPCSSFIFKDNQCVLKAAPSSLTAGGRGVACMKERKLVKVDENKDARFTCDTGSATAAPLRIVPRSEEKECRLLCAASAACEFFVINEKGICVLMAEGAKTAAHGSMSGKVCKRAVPSVRAVRQGVVRKDSKSALEHITAVKGYQCWRTSYESGTITVVEKVPSHVECANACTKLTNCVIAVHHPSDKRCMLKSLHALPTEGEENAVACVADSVQVFNKFHCTTASSFTDGTLGLLNDVTLDACREQCEKMDECKLVQYTHSTRACDLKSFEASQVAGRVGVTACVRLERQHRTLRALAEAETNQISLAAFEIELSVPRLDATTWDSVDAVPTDDSFISLSANTDVRTPAGVDPTEFGLAATDSIGVELGSADNLFMDSLNPSFEDLGLTPLSVSDSWTLTNGGDKWTTIVNEQVVLPLYLNTPDGIDFEKSEDRQWILRNVATSTRLNASTASFDSYNLCADQTSACVPLWEAATPDTTGGSRGADPQAAAGKPSNSLVLKVDVPLGDTKAAFCDFLRSSLECDTIAQTGIGAVFGVFACGDCNGVGSVPSTPAPDTPAPDQAPIDSAPIDAAPIDDGLTSFSAARRLLGVGSPSACTTGWRPQYGLLSDAFTLDTIVGTLDECITNCTTEAGCYAFSRSTTVEDSDRSACILKKAVLPAGGDDVTHNSLATYVVTCPPSPTPCNWKYLYGSDIISSNDTGVVNAISLAHCKRMCQHVADCTGVTYNDEDGLCHFAQSEIISDSVSMNGTAVKSAICYRGFSSECSANATCGDLASTQCIPMGNEEICTCARGFGCTTGAGSCFVHGTDPTCTRQLSLGALFAQAVTDVLGVDRAGLYLSATGKTGTPPAPVPTTEDVVEVKQLPVDIPTTFVLSVTLDNMDVDQVLKSAGSITKVRTMLNDFASILGVSESLLELQHACQLTSSGVQVMCKKDDGTSTTVADVPQVKVTPSSDRDAGMAWCGASSATMRMPQFENQAGIEAFLLKAKGEILETRAYWTGATCSQDCTNSAQWTWADGSSIDWSLAVSTHTFDDQHKCAVLQWDTTLFRWGIAATDCSTYGHYPVCEETSTSTEDAGQCSTSGSCDVKITYSVQLTQSRNVDFVKLPDGTLRQYHPSDNLPVGMKIVKNDIVLGYIDSEGKTTALVYPPKDTITNLAVKSASSPDDYPSVAVKKFFSSVMVDALTRADLATGFVSACHEYYFHLHVKCSYDTMSCQLVQPLYILATSCEGFPPCLNNVCLSHGYVRGHVGHCQCICDEGYTGQDCGQCDTGYMDYPNCTKDETNTTLPTSPLYAVVQFRFEQGQQDIAGNLGAFATILKEVLGQLASVYYVSYVCSGTVCNDGYCAIQKPINEWSSIRSAACVAYGTTLDEENAVLDRSGVVLSSTGSVVEIHLTMQAFYSQDSDATAAALNERLTLATTRSDMLPFVLELHYLVYGPTHEPYSPLVYNQTIPNQGATAVEEATQSNTAIIIICVVGGVCCLCLSVLFAIWRYRKSKRDQEKETTEDLLKSLEDYDDYDDFLTIYKEAHEPMGIMWDDHTLLVGVCDGSPAATHGAERFRNRRVCRVNGVKVTKLSDIRDLVEGEPVVTLEFEPRYSSIVVCLAETLADFDEEGFLYAFAERVAYALDLMDFSEADMDIQGVQDMGGELQVTIKFFGLTAEQVAAIVAMCVTPGDPIKDGLPITGAFLAGAESKTVPKLWVCCQWLSEAAEASGVYLPLPNVFEAGMPVWQQAPADHWMYSSPSGHWVVVDQKSLIGTDALGAGYILRSEEPHRGALPHAINKWRTPLREDKHVVVASEEPRAHEFVVGQKVLFPAEFQLEDGSVISKDSLGLVMCADGELVQVCLLNEEYDIVTITPDALDSPDGPAVSVKHEDKWMDATIVKEKHGMIKVRFDCNLCPSIWLDKNSEDDLLRLRAPPGFVVGDHVRLSGTEGLGALAPGEVGEVVACSDGGQARPFLVQGPYETYWYSAYQVEKVDVQYSGGSSLPYGDESLPFGHAAEHSEANYMREGTNPYGTTHDSVSSAYGAHDSSRKGKQD